MCIRDSATGARGLRSIVEHILRRPMFEIPSQSDVRQCVVDADTVEGKAPVTLVRNREDGGRVRREAGEA